MPLNAKGFGVVLPFAVGVEANAVVGLKEKLNGELVAVGVAG